jgi:hypothetical protein
MKYHPSRLSLSPPLLSIRTDPAYCINHPFTLTQFSPNAIRIRVMVCLKIVIGSNNLATAKTMIGMNQKKVLAVRPAKNMTPRMF